MDHILSLKNVTKTFEDVPGKKLLVIDKVNLEISSGEFFVFVGPSGSGKSTLLRIMSGLDKDCSGEVVLSSEVGPRDVSFVFQQFALLPWLTVHQNIELGLLAQGVSIHERNAIVSRELTQFNLENFAHAYPRELSGGMKQRVGLARALATNPKIIFMDEPFSELDSFTAAALRQDFLNVWHERKVTIVMVSHNVEEALELADRIAVLTPSPAKIEKNIINHLERPRNKRSADFYTLEDELYKLIKP